MIKTADGKTDFGSDRGGEIVAAGLPRAIVKEKRSYTGAFLREVLARRPAGRKRGAASEAAE